VIELAVDSAWPRSVVATHPVGSFVTGFLRQTLICGRYLISGRQRSPTDRSHWDPGADVERRWNEWLPTFGVS
jgi:hypothetical protein